MRGYDVEEVRAYLEALAEEFERLGEKERTAASEVVRLNTELESYQKLEQSLKVALANAQATLSEARESAKREADLLRREAEVQAARLVSEARAWVDSVKREVADLESRREALARKLKSILRSELDLIDMLLEEDQPPAGLPETKGGLSGK